MLIKVEEIDEKISEVENRQKEAEEKYIMAIQKLRLDLSEALDKNMELTQDLTKAKYRA